jgi:hypothetical protein
MINFYNQVPSVYINASRDFQYLSWLINIVLNSVKHNVDDIYSLPNNNADPRLVELLAMTLGFKIRRNYDQAQLAAIVDIIPSILKNKGNIIAINMAGEALIKASGSPGSFRCEVEDGCCLKAVFPKELVDITLFLDLLPYILPAGMSCKVVRKTELEETIAPIELSHDDTLYAAWKSDIDLSAMYNVDKTNSSPNFANFERPIIGDTDPILELNAGLLDNSILPMFISSEEEVNE